MGSFWEDLSLMAGRPFILSLGKPRFLVGKMTWSSGERMVRVRNLSGDFLRGLPAGFVPSLGAACRRWLMTARSMVPSETWRSIFQ